jgi:hypothetical protein
MEQILVNFNSAKCYIDDIILKNLILGNHMQHLQEVFGRLLKHIFEVHLGKCRFFHTWVEYLSQHDLFRWIRGVEGQG